MTAEEKLKKIMEIINSWDEFPGNPIMNAEFKLQKIKKILEMPNPFAKDQIGSVWTRE